LPTIFVINGYRFFFFSNEGTEPIHVHVEKTERYAKFWLQPFALARNHKFSSSDLSYIQKIINEHRGEIEEKWNEHFGPNRSEGGKG
jgi:hypothetical protein